MNGLSVTKSLPSPVVITVLHLVEKSMSLDVLHYACPWAAATRTVRGSFSSSEHLPAGTGSYLIPIRLPPFAACVDSLVLARRFSRIEAGERSEVPVDSASPSLSVTIFRISPCQEGIIASESRQMGRGNHTNNLIRIVMRADK